MLPVGQLRAAPPNITRLPTGGVRYVLFPALRASDRASNGSCSSATAPVLLGTHNLAAS